MLNTIRTGAVFAALLAVPAFAQDGAMTEGHLQMLDLDEDGAVSVTEYRIYTSNAFIVLDTDNDDLLAAGDFHDLITEAQFAAMDKDADQKVSRAEYDAEVLADFAAADQNGNGVLD